MIMFINHGWHFDVVKLKCAMTKPYSHTRMIIDEFHLTDKNQITSR